MAWRGRGAASETTTAAPAAPTSAAAATRTADSLPNVMSAASTATRHKLTTSRILAMIATPDAWATLTPRRRRASPTHATSAEGPGSSSPAAHDAAVTPSSSTGSPRWRGRQSQNLHARPARKARAPATAKSTGNGPGCTPSHSTEYASACQTSTRTPTETTLASAARTSARLRRRSGELMVRDCPQTAFPQCCEVRTAIGLRIIELKGGRRESPCTLFSRGGSMGSTAMVIVLGADGYLGWPTSLHLAAQGYDVVAVDNMG